VLFKSNTKYGVVGVVRLPVCLKGVAGSFKSKAKDPIVGGESLSVYVVRLRVCRHSVLFKSNAKCLVVCLVRLRVWTKTAVGFEKTLAARSILLTLVNASKCG
jgi:hypothetical protein